MNELPSVTVLIPARNEEADIDRCLEAVLAQDHPHDRMEIVLVDGGSTDATASIAARVLKKGAIDWKIVDSPAGTTPRNLNAGLAVASGDVLCRVDARSIVSPDYVRLCAEVLKDRPDVAVTGGAQVAVPRDSSAHAVGIARALNNRYAMGGARYRVGADSGPGDTVYLGAFRTCQLRDAGGWDDYFETNQDYELNRRMGRRGVVWFDARLVVGYVPRGTLRELWQQYHRFGRWKVRYWRRTEDLPQRRQVGPVIALPAALALSVPLIRTRRRMAVFWTLLSGGAGALLLDAAGGQAPRPGLVARGVAAATSAVVVAAWTAGVWHELILGDGADG